MGRGSPAQLLRPRGSPGLLAHLPRQTRPSEARCRHHSCAIDLMVPRPNAALQNELLSGPHVSRVYAVGLTCHGVFHSPDRTECLPPQPLTGLALCNPPAPPCKSAALPLLLPCPKCHTNGVTKHVACGFAPLHSAKRAQRQLCCCATWPLPLRACCTHPPGAQGLEARDGHLSGSAGSNGNEAAINTHMALLAPSFPGALMTRAYQVSVFHFLGTVPFSSGCHVCAFVSIWQRRWEAIQRPGWKQGCQEPGTGEGTPERQVLRPLLLQEQTAPLPSLSLSLIHI